MHKKRWYMLTGCVALLIALGSALNMPWLSESMIRRFLATKPGMVVRRVHIERQQFTFPGRLEWQQVDLMFEVNGKLLMVQAPEVVLTGLQTLWSKDRRVLFAAQRMLVRYDQGQAKEARADLVIDGDGIDGPLSAVEVCWDKLRVKDLSVFLIINAAGVELRAVKCAAYGGKISGKVFIDTSPGKQAGIYAADLFVEAMDMARLAEVNPEISVQLEGLVTGTLKFEGDPKALRTVDTDLSMPLGGRVSAALLGALTQYLPSSREKKRLDVLIQKGGKLAMEGFSFTMKGGQAGKFAGEVRLKSREINLELNLSHEINTDGTIDALVGYWEKVFQ